MGLSLGKVSQQETVPRRFRRSEDILNILLATLATVAFDEFIHCLPVGPANMTRVSLDGSAGFEIDEG
jgi:hypothetical protein